MQRIPEPELMDDAAQARAYAEADFSEPHAHFVALFQESFPGEALAGTVLDLGCGPADVTLRLARAYPRCQIDGLDGAAAMLEFGQAAVRKAGLEARIRLVQGYLPGAEPPRAAYDAVVSNSLLHHLADPATLWASIKRWAKPGAPVLVMDLLRPDSPATLEALVSRYAAEAPEVLRRDFANSLGAAYRLDEAREQLAQAGLAGLAVRAVSDRHLIVSGRLAA